LRLRKSGEVKLVKNILFKGIPRLDEISGISQTKRKGRKTIC